MAAARLFVELLVWRMRMTTGRSNLITVAVELRHETDAAFLIFDGENEIWIPKSQCEMEAIEGKENLFDLELPEWLAKDKELI